MPKKGCGLHVAMRVFMSKWIIEIFPDQLNSQFVEVLHHTIAIFVSRFIGSFLSFGYSPSNSSSRVGLILLSHCCDCTYNIISLTIFFRNFIEKVLKKIATQPMKQVGGEVLKMEEKLQTSRRAKESQGEPP